MFRVAEVGGWNQTLGIVQGILVDGAAETSVLEVIVPVPMSSVAWVALPYSPETEPFLRNRETGSSHGRATSANPIHLHYTPYLCWVHKLENLVRNNSAANIIVAIVPCLETQQQEAGCEKVRALAAACMGKANVHGIRFERLESFL